jgi:ABC-2 type transport system permease protein
MLEIAARDLARLFASPLGWCVLALNQLVLGLFFFIVLLWDFGERQALLVAAKSSFGITAMVAAPLFKAAALIMMFTVPLLTMHALASERRDGTLALLLSSPVSMTGIVLGKYLSLAAFLALMSALVTLMPLSLALGGKLDIGLLLSAAAGLYLSVATFAAAGLWVSSLTRHPASAAAATLGLLLALWFVDFGGATGPDGPARALEWLSLTRHADALMRGVFASDDLAYFGLLIVGFVTFTVRRLDALRLGM